MRSPAVSDQVGVSRLDETVQMRTSSASRPSRRTRQSGFDGINRDPVEPDELCLIGAATVSCVSEEERPASIANPFSTFPTGVAQPEPVASVLSEQQGRAYSVPTSVFTGSLRVAGFVRPPSVGVQPKEVEVPSANHEQGHQIAVGRRAQQMVQAGGAKASIQGSGVEEPSGEKLGAVLWPGAGSPDTAWHVRSAERQAQGVHQQFVLAWMIPSLLYSCGAQHGASGCVRAGAHLQINSSITAGPNIQRS